MIKKNPQIVDLKTIAWNVVEKYGFKPRFPKELLQNIRRLNNTPPQFYGKDYIDLRHLIWSSIDNFDSMDLDQTEYCERGINGDIHVKVAISDVDHLVPKFSPADRHAGYNGTSVYTGIITFPMLPDELSKGITSLLPGQDCMALIIEFIVHQDGKFTPGNIYRGIVSNKAKLVYEETGDWLEGIKSFPDSYKNNQELMSQLRLQNEAAEKLRTARKKLGALDLETLEAHLVIKDDIVTDLVVQKQNAARCLIEEFMVASNSTIVSFLEKAGLPMIQRVVRVPKYWNEIRLTAEEYGVSLPLHPDAKELSHFLISRKIADPERFPDLSLTIVKLLGNGEYVSYIPGKAPIGHFALAVSDYTHGTAPNRRYVDLIIQRLIKSVLDDQNYPYNIPELNERAEWLTGREKAANKVERYMRKAAAAVILKPRIGDNFEGFITGASIKGTYIRLISPPAEGRVVIGENGLKVGRKVIVKLIKTDPYNGHLDFEYVGSRHADRKR